MIVFFFDMMIGLLIWDLSDLYSGFDDVRIVVDMAWGVGYIKELVKF